MAKKRSPSEVIQSVSNVKIPSYVSWASGSKVDRDRAFAAMDAATQECTGIVRAYHGHRHHDYSNLQSNVSGRPGLGRSDYGAFRPLEDIPVRRLDILDAVEDAYQRISLVRNIIDLMGDFACQGIRLTHPNPRVEKFYKSWFKRVQGKDRSERFLNILYRLGTVVITIQNAKIKSKQKQNIFRSVAEPEDDYVPVGTIKQPKGVVPWIYTFINPRDVEAVGGPVAAFLGERQYALKLSNSLAQIIRSPKSDEEKALVAKLPSEVKRAANSPGKQIVLPIDKTEVFHYKKDDWKSWSIPMLYASLTDLAMLDKLKLSDIAALDGAISNIRIFKLGDLEHKIAPTQAAISKLSEVLQSHTGAGTFDFIWGPDIQLIQTSTDVHNFLGEEKYKPTLNSIYAGLGIPPTLTGTFGTTGTTNNFISLKTLIKRLQYGRDILNQFWEKEIRKVQMAMGFRFPATVEFDNMNLGDEEAEKALLIQLADRDIISQELLQHKFGHNPETEKVRINRENRERRGNSMPNKAGPWHDPQPDNSLKKIALQTGVAAPSEVGLELFPKKAGEKSVIELQSTETPSDNQSGIPQQGRPKNSKDSKKRKTKRFTPKLKAVELWASEAQSKIAEILNPGFLHQYGKKNIRSFNTVQHKEIERIKFYVLCCHEPFSEVSVKSVCRILEQKTNKVVAEINQLYNDIVNSTSSVLNKSLTVDEARSIQAYVYAVYYEGE